MAVEMVVKMAGEAIAEATMAEAMAYEMATRRR